MKFIHDNWDSDDLRATVSRIVEGDIFIDNFETLVPGFIDKVTEYVALIREHGMDAALSEILGI